MKPGKYKIYAKSIITISAFILFQSCRAYDYQLGINIDHPNPFPLKSVAAKYKPGEQVGSLLRTQPSPTLPAQASEVVLFEDATDGYLSKILQSLQRPSADRGLLLSSVAFPAVGLLLRETEGGGDLHRCSGVLISKRHFLTAAHCVCEKPGGFYHRSFSACVASGAPTQFKSYVFLPSIGLLSTNNKPYIMENYDNPEIVENLNVNSSKLADLAIVELGVDVDVKTPSFIVSAQGGKYASVGYGQASVNRSVTAESGFQRGIYGPSLGTVAFPEVVQCDLPFRDVVCGYYSSLRPGEAGISTAVCPGDSGGPLFTIGTNGVISLVGITSGRRSLSGKCDTQYEALSIYTSVQQHSEWIQSVVKPADVNPPSLGYNENTCQEALFTPPKSGYAIIRIKSDPGKYTVISGLTAGVDSHPDPAIEEAPSTGHSFCKHVLGKPNLLICTTEISENISLILGGSGLAQLSVCQH